MDAKPFEGVKVAWLLPRIEPGSGGQQTVFRHVTHLQELGAECHVLACQFGIADEARAMTAMMRDSYGCRPDKVFDVPYSEEDYDLAIATMNTTVPYLLELSARERAYFVQDYEPYFYPVGEDYINALNTYRDDLSVITIGRWLVHKLDEAHGLKARHTEFTADKALYHPLGTPRQKAVCAIFQPSKFRRCPHIVAETLELVHMVDPEVKIIVYGQNVDYPFSFPVECRGLVSKQQCNELYNECMVGLCISSTNPSRVPFEMMAAGLPVVDVCADNMLWDFPSDSALLAEPTPASLACAVLSLVQDPERARRASEAGLAFMAGRNAGDEQSQFADAVASILTEGAQWAGYRPEQLYTRPAVKAPAEMRELERVVHKRNGFDFLTAPAINLKSRYMRVGVRGIPPFMSPLDLFFIVRREDAADARVMRYNVRGEEDGEYWMQIDADDFGGQPGLYHCEALSEHPGMRTDPRLVERSFRIVPDELADTAAKPGDTFVSSRGGMTLSFTVSDTPYAFSLKSAVKHALPDSAVVELRKLLDKVR